MMISKSLLSALLVVLTASMPGPVGAQEERADGPTPPRLARTSGEVSFWRPGADEWSPAQINMPLAAGDRLYAPSGAEALVEVASRADLRVGGDTELGVASLETGYLQLEVPSGRVALDLERLPTGQRIEVDTPNGALIIDRAGYYRLDVDDETVVTVRRGGEATAIPADGDERLVPDGDRAILRGTESASIVTNRAPEPDAWDGFDEHRTASRPPRAESAQYVPPDVAGAGDLDEHGDWRPTPDYGTVWVPRDVGPDWAPYTTGRWVFDPYYEWTWVDDAPWGWAPYHYGRWVSWDGYWGWAPGPVIARPVYAPALVGFVDLPGVSVSVNVGTPFVGWVALGWGEPCLPWWGPRGFRGRPYWGGWRGPRYVNNVYVDNRRIVNVRHIDRYRNFDARNGVVAIRRDRFGRGRDAVRLGRTDVRNARPIRGGLGVRPVSTSLVARAGRGRRPPDRVRNRSVVATRAPQDTSRSLRRAGLPVPSRGGEARLTKRARVQPLDGRPRGDRSHRQAWRGDAPPPPRGDRRERSQAPWARRDGGTRPDRSPDRGVRRNPDVHSSAPPAPRPSAGRARPGSDDRRVRGADRTTFDRRAARSVDRRIDVTPPPRLDRAPQPGVARRSAPVPRAQRREPQGRMRAVEPPRRQPRFEAPGRAALPRREAPSQRPRGRFPEASMRQRQQSFGGTRGAAPSRPQMRPQGRADGGSRGRGGGDGGGRRGGGERRRDG